MSLKGKNALIAGSSRGIGRGIALKLAESGANVAVHYFQNEAAAKQTLAMIHDRGSQGFILQADTTKPDEIVRMIKKVHADFGALDIFVSNARPEVEAFFQPPMDITLTQCDAAFDSQAKGFLVGARGAAAVMPDGGPIFPI